jgi:hypothetical protein
MSPDYGITWPDGSFTGAITDQYRLAVAYAKAHEGRVYEVGGPADPERGGTKQPPGSLTEDL